MKITLFILFSIFSHSIFAESQQFYGFRPQINITKDIHDKWDLNVFTSTHPILTDKNDGRAQSPADIQYFFRLALFINTVPISILFFQDTSIKEPILFLRTLLMSIESFIRQFTVEIPSSGGLLNGYASKKDLFKTEFSMKLP